MWPEIVIVICTYSVLITIDDIFGDTVDAQWNPSLVEVENLLFLENLIHYKWCRISSINTIGFPQHFYVAGPPSDGFMLSEATYSQSGENFKELLNRTGHQPTILLVADEWTWEGLDDHRRWWKQKKKHQLCLWEGSNSSFSSYKCYRLLHIVSSCHLEVICSSDLRPVRYPLWLIPLWPSPAGHSYTACW